MIKNAETFPSILDTIGNTPIVKLQNLPAQHDVELLAKLEFLNPGGSTKDRPLLAMVEHAEQNGELGPGGVIIDSSSGNFAIAMAMVGAVKGYRTICVVDPNLTENARKMILSLGGELEFVDSPDASGSFLKSRLKRRSEMLQTVPKAWCPNQYHNTVSGDAHYYGTGHEIVDQVNGDLDYLVVATGTGGTIGGCARAIKENIPHAKVVAVDAVGSQIFYDHTCYRLQKGLGSSLNKEQLVNLDVGAIDEVRFVNDQDAFVTARALVRNEGIMSGGSSGAAIFAALTLCREVPAGSRIVTVLPDRLERYLDEHNSDDWMVQHNFDVDASPTAVWNAVDRWIDNAKLVSDEPKTLMPSVPTPIGHLFTNNVLEAKGAMVP